MCDVLLVNPKSFRGLPSYLPYGILYIASFLRERGIDVLIYDSNVDDRKFTTILKKYNPKIVGFSVLSGLCINDAIEKSLSVRKILKDGVIVWGGVHVTIFPELVLKQSFVDFIIANEGEYPFYELCHKILNGDKYIEHIKNLGYKDNKLHINEIRPFINLDILSLPAWDLVPIEKYIHNKFYSDQVITLHTSRGCPWSCAYCYNELVNFRKWRGMSAENILKQILHLKDNYGIKAFQFYDDEFDANPKRAIAFSNLLLEKNVKIKWAHYSRTNIADAERYALQKKAGCEFIEYGVESGSDRILELIRKKQNVETTINAFEICRDVGLKTGAMFMVGMPTETREDVDKTISLVRSLNAHQAICTIFRPYPGSELFNWCITNNRFRLPKDLNVHGDAFNIGNSEINVSEVDSRYLNKIQGMFDFSNILNEVLACLKNKNWKLLIYYLKKMNVSQLLRINSGMLKWLTLR